jgi:hypothetical protein
MPTRLASALCVIPPVVTAEGPLDNVMPGLTCEACHGPGADHVAAIKAGSAVHECKAA